MKKTTTLAALAAVAITLSAGSASAFSLRDMLESGGTASISTRARQGVIAEFGKRGVDQFTAEVAVGVLAKALGDARHNFPVEVDGMTIQAEAGEKSGGCAPAIVRVSRGAEAVSIQSGWCSGKGGYSATGQATIKGSLASAPAKGKLGKGDKAAAGKPAKGKPPVTQAPASSSIDLGKELGSTGGDKIDLGKELGE